MLPLRPAAAIHLGARRFLSNVEDLPAEAHWPANGHVHEGVGTPGVVRGGVCGLQVTGLSQTCSGRDWL